MTLSIIAAVGKNGELGLNNNLIWKIPGDMKFFKEQTLSHTDIDVPKVEVYHSIPEFLNDYKDSEEEIFNIGGASIYKALLEYTDKIYLTEIEASSNADAYFPHFNKDEYDTQILDKKQDENTKIKYKHVLYKRR